MSNNRLTPRSRYRATPSSGGVVGRYDEGLDDLEFIATGNGNITPKITFTGTCDVYVQGVRTALTSTSEATIAVLTGQTIKYVFSNVAGVTSLNMYADPISGDIGQLNTFTSLTYLNLYNTSIDGDISNLSGLTSLTVLNLGNTSIDGNISNLSGLTSLTYLYLYSTSVTWSAGALDALVAMTTCHLGNLSWSEGDTNSALASCRVNEDARAGSTPNCTLTLTGNTIPTGQGATDVLYLQHVDQGWTVTVDS